MIRMPPLDIPKSRRARTSRVTPRTPSLLLVRGPCQRQPFLLDDLIHIQAGGVDSIHTAEILSLASQKDPWYTYSASVPPRLSTLLRLLIPSSLQITCSYQWRVRLKEPILFAATNLWIRRTAGSGSSSSGGSSSIAGRTSSPRLPPRSPSPDWGYFFSFPAVAGGVVGGVAVIAIVAALLFWLKRRQEREAAGAELGSQWGGQSEKSGAPSRYPPGVGSPALGGDGGFYVSDTFTALFPAS